MCAAWRRLRRAGNMLEVLCVEMERRDCGRSKDLAASRSCNNRTTRASNRSRAAPSSGWMSTTSCRQRRSEALLMKLAARNPMRTQRRAGVAQSGSEPRMPVVVSTPSTLAGAPRPVLERLPNQCNRKRQPESQNRNQHAENDPSGSAERIIHTRGIVDARVSS
jgi:hypothetical protein